MKFVYLEVLKYIYKNKKNRFISKFVVKIVLVVII